MITACIEEGALELAAGYAQDALEVDGDAAAAVEGLRVLAARGVGAAQFVLALCALEGRGMAPDRAQALSLLETAAALPGTLGARARCCLAVCLMGDGGEEEARQCLDVDVAAPHLPRAFHLLASSAAEANVGESFFFLARAHLRGIGTAVDEPAGAAALQLAADQGFGEALFDLSECHRLGVGVPKDKSRARELRQRAWETGFVDKRALGDGLTVTHW